MSSKYRFDLIVSTGRGRLGEDTGCSGGRSQTRWTSTRESEWAGLHGRVPSPDRSFVAINSRVLYF